MFSFELTAHGALFIARLTTTFRRIARASRGLFSYKLSLGGDADAHMMFSA